ncbi:MAG: sodium-translocating pyrophosphatase [Kiritimatiellae bacterium]|nr:sodium-translocating pyrophosphatase [Kiritimatiellia bacterium]
MSIDMWLFFAIGLGVVSLGFALYLYAWVNRQDAGGARGQQIAGYIQDGARAYLAKLYGTLAVLVVVLGVLIALIFSLDMLESVKAHQLVGCKKPLEGVWTALAFVAGSACSGLAGYLGMSIAVRANLRAAVAAKVGLNPAFKVAFYAGAVLGMAMVGTAVIGISVIYLFTRDPEIILGFSLGASAMALLAKAGGGIFTKTADIAADLVGKVEAGIPEDDPRNPAVIADNVGDNVGDVAGMGADIFDSYVASAVAAMILGVGVGRDTANPEFYVVFPLVLCAVGMLASFIGIQFVRVGKNGKPGAALNSGTVITCVIFGVLATLLVLAGGYNLGVLIATISGLVIAVLIGFCTDYFTNDERRPVQQVAAMSKSGSAITIITGLSYGLISVVPSMIGIVIATLVSYFSAEAFGISGIYGIGIAAVGMLSITSVIVSADAYGPIVDNAKGIAEMSNMGHEVVERCDTLDSAGNTAKAITKGFAISAAALTVLALFAAYGEVLQGLGLPLKMDLQSPLVLGGVLLGATCPPVFSALLMLAVTKNAFLMIEEIRAQFRAKPGILKGTEIPDYARCVSIASAGALSSLALPAVIAVIIPLAVGLLLGTDALGGFLGGSIFTGVIFAMFMSNAGGLWDNGKKFIEAGHHGGPGSDAHKAAVVGDTVGDPFKDTAGPSINTLITVMSLVSSLFAPVIAALSLANFIK